MAFFRRLMDHLFNQVLVDSLAHSRWFQRFVVQATKLSQDVTAKGSEGSKVLDQQWSRFQEAAKQKASELRKEFEQELRRVQEAESKKQRRM